MWLLLRVHPVGIKCQREFLEQPMFACSLLTHLGLVLGLVCSTWLVIQGRNSSKWLRLAAFVTLHGHRYIVAR